MGEYLFSAFALSLIFSLMSYLSYSVPSERALRCVRGILLLYLLLLPLSSLTLKLGELDFSYPQADFIGENLTEDTAEEAFSEGIRALVAERCNIAEKNVSVRVFGFDFSAMRAERVMVFLSGAGALADWRTLENYLDSLGLGDCEVELLID